MSEALFFLFSFLTLYGAVITVSHRDLVVSALHLAGSMLALAGLFFILGAHFIAGVQVVVYAGAVMVLFVMAVMLFDFKKKSGGLFGKTLWPALSLLFFLAGLTAGTFPLSLHLFHPRSFNALGITDTKELSALIFTQYVFVFEVLGLLLLLIAVGVATLCRSDPLRKARKNLKKGTL